MPTINQMIEDIFGSEDETPEERAQQAEDERVRALEKKIQLYCEKSFGWTFSASYAVNYDGDQISISPDDEEVTFDQLKALSVLGTDITVTASSKAYGIMITMTVHKGLSISTT